jgi:hypothetical protein
MKTWIANTQQTSIFDEIAAGEAAEAGMNLSAENNRPMLEFARGLAVELGRAKRFVTADDIQRVLVDKGFPESSLGNAAGSVFRGGNWRWNGQTVKSTRVASHGRLIRIWEYVGK